MAHIRKPAVPAKLFKHFAIGTVALTVIVAMLADGSEHHAEAEASAAEASVADADKDMPTLVRRDIGWSGDDYDSGGDYGDSVGTFGAPMMSPAQSGGTSRPNRAAGGGTRPPVAGYGQAYLDSLSDEEYEALVEGLREAGMLDPSQREARLASLARQSAARSGSATPD